MHLKRPHFHAERLSPSPHLLPAHAALRSDRFGGAACTKRGQHFQHGIAAVLTHEQIDDIGGAPPGLAHRRDIATGSDACQHYVALRDDTCGVTTRARLVLLCLRDRARMCDGGDMTTSYPWLMQRVRHEAITGRTGVDRFFSMEYMGAAEFEFGALPAAMSEFRASAYDREPRKLKLMRGGAPFVLWFVGEDSQAGVATSMFQRAFDGERLSLKESLALYRLDDPDISSWQRNDGWFAVDGTPPWAVFLKKDHARDWLKGLAESSVAKATKVAP